MTTMDTSSLKAHEIKGLLFIRDNLLYQGRTPTLQAIADHVGFKSRRASSLLIDRLIAKGLLARTPAGSLRVLSDLSSEGAQDRTVPVPLVGSAPCGAPLLAAENISATFPVSQRIARPGANYFLLRAVGNSMNLAGIEDGNLVLVRQQPVANEGDRVVALIDDEATIKELRRSGDKVLLMPRSTDASHRPIILDRDFLIQGIVLDAFSIDA
jgi:repressor LexA